VDAALAQEAVKRLVTGMPVNAPASPSTPLSARELDVLRWIV
jgi:DNA-binding CsgD family transcriptional regulator